MATIKIDEDTLLRIKNLAEKRDRSPHWIMVEAIKQYIETEEKALEEERAWLQSGIDALRDAEKNGYACTAEELKEEIEHLKETKWKVQA